MTRAAREAKKYSEFRTAFGRKLHQFPLVAGQIADLDRNAKRSTCGAFKIYRKFSQLDGKVKVALDPSEPLESQRKRFDVRQLVMLQKIVVSRDAVDQLRMAMSIFGGHGVMEDFSSLPRLYRDAAVNELWEGPHNVLLSQIHRDLQKVKSWYRPAEFVRNLMAGTESGLVQELASQIESLVAHPSLLEKDTATMEACRRWDAFCTRLFHAYQDLAMEEVNPSE
jgi:hypothetical protein